MAQITGTTGNDVLNGTAESDYYSGSTGDDIIRGLGGDDVLTDGHGADQLFGDDGDDRLSLNLLGGGRALADGGIGNDIIYVANGGGPNQSVTLIGGAGNDTITLHGFARGNLIDAGEGDDLVHLGSTLAAQVTLGAGADRVVLDPWNFAPDAGGIVITDYSPGIDRLDIGFEGRLSGWSGENNPFGEGFVRLLQDGADTLFQIDANGGGDAWVTKLRFQNLAPAAFTAADFGGYPPDGSTPAGRTIVGTDARDDLVGTVGADTISGGGGFDFITAGAGNDIVDGGLDGDNINGGSGDDIIHGGDGNDYILDGRGADQLFGDAGDDVISINLSGGGRLLADGGIGNDTFSVGNGGGPNQSVTLIGGAGNDSITLHGFARGNIIDAGDGDDLVHLGSTLAAQITLGAGADRVVLDPGNFSPDAGGIVITDYQPGIDRLDVGFEGRLSGWSGENNPFSEGFVRLVQDGSDTLYQVDANGGGDGWVTKLRFQNLAPSAFGAADFGGYPPDGSAPAGVTIVGTDARDELVGTVGADTISGGGGFDFINAGGGNDIVDGGLDGDNITGGSGNDIIRGGDGDDYIVDGRGADQLFGEGGNDILSINLSGGGRLFADGGIGNDTLSVINGNGPNQSVTLIGGAGNDSITMDGFAGGNIIDAGEGDDVVRLGSTLAAQITLGGGADLLALQSNFGGTGGINVTDWALGVDHLSPGLAQLLFGWDGSSNPFAGGFLNLSQSGANTILEIDRSGGGDAYSRAIVFENIAVAAFAQAEFAGFAPGDGTPPGQNRTGTVAADTLIGGAGHDRLYGIAGDDALDGHDGNDLLDGGAGNDVLVGGLGLDTLTGGSGVDLFRDTAAGLAGDTITDLAVGERIVFTDAAMGSFSASLTGNLLTFTGGSLTLGSVPAGHMTFNGSANGGVELLFRTNAVANDFNGDGRSDVLWRDFYGAVTNWLAQPDGGFVGNSANAFNQVSTSWQIAGIGDFNGDGRNDIVWRHSLGGLAEWLGQANGGFTANANVSATAANAWRIAGTGDFNGDGRDDILWRHDGGGLTNWLGQADGSFVGNNNANNHVDNAWQIAATGDFNGDGRDDIIFRHSSGSVTEWLGQASGSYLSNHTIATAQVGNDWRIIGAGDFNGDGRDDVLWRHASGLVTDWLGRADGGFVNNGNASTAVTTAWHIVAIGDYNGDGRDDLAWRDNGHGVSEWLGQANGGFVSNHANAANYSSTSWQVQAPDVFFM